MENEEQRNIDTKNIVEEREIKTTDVIYNSEKDFYKGIGGKMRFKAEGLFKKAKEKGISIDEISISTIKDHQVEMPGIGIINLPSYFVKIKGKDMRSGQNIVDGKHIDYFNMYQKYVADRIIEKNQVEYGQGIMAKDENDENTKNNAKMSLSEWERFEIGKRIVEDKEFGLEKTITGACDRVIRKLMGENDWLYPEEAKLLDEEFSDVQNRILKGERDSRVKPVKQRKATERQINYFKTRIKNLGLDPDNKDVINEVIRQSGFEVSGLSELTTIDMSRLIDTINYIVPKVKESLSSNKLN